MSEMNYKPNSHRYREQQAQKEAQEEKRIEKVVKGSVKTKKKNDLHKLADVFISEDVKNVKSYVLMDVLVPAIKKAISDIIVNGIDMVLYGESSSRRRNGRDSYVSYRSYSDPRDDRRPRSDTRAKTRFDFDEIIFESRGEAEAVRMQMEDVIERYGLVTVADMYDMAGLTEPYTSNKYGWTSVRTAETVRVRDGYIIKLPKASPID